MKKVFNYILIFFSFFSLLFLTSCFKKEELVNNRDITIKENNKLNIENKENISKSFLLPKNNLEKEINKIEETNINNYLSKLKLVKLYLKYGNFYFKEDVFADKALNILNKMEENSVVDYFKGYAYEIQTKYDIALKQYNKVLNYENLDIKEQINVLNQIGHIYDLQGFLEKANKQYLEAEKLDKEVLKTILNRGRYEFRIGNYDLAEKYFKKILDKTEESTIISEIYYNLSLIYKEKKEGLEQAIEYAKLGIKVNKDYPNNYLSLGILYIAKGGDLLDNAPSQIKKSIELYPYSSMSYKYLGIYYYIKDDFDKAIENFHKQVEMSNKDILIMAGDKINIERSGIYDLARSYAYKGDIKNTIKYLDLILNGENKNYYYLFLRDFSNENGPYVKLMKNKEFNNKIKNIILQYNNKKNEK